MEQERENARAEKDLKELFQIAAPVEYARRHADEMLADLYSKPVRRLHMYRNGRSKHRHNLASWQSPTYVSWRALIQRCTNPTNARWASYGGQGVEVCELWRTFEGFLASMGERPEGTTLGRFGDVGNYEPGNCKWMTQTEQNVEKQLRRADLAMAA